ncbi:MTA/SAH nucleosidase [Emticicia oligotrophica DSM 17448]|uniref:adenosylhomocysteine nucleosidase n=1 Tax=Emticicia oligotrophica (strain DSM 17448 / CIP 109782 / MTCC 6937 / GPTSA100-15) TaxID=929562 RepID=A0ABM5MYE9_EMTOG|nr:5'-methylthioadenosine/adenosylhomocysteine nucleosidase [Emticicia oligotrophica]AFK02129.1 MTA/SAH nucleosidase [Emticicia oligotrophica DSM 17448]
MRNQLLFFIIILLSSSSFGQKIAILGAMTEEVQLLESQLKQAKTKQILGFEYKTGKLSGKKVVIAQTGIGKVNASITTTLIIKVFRPKSIIFTGVAGAVSSELNQGDILIGKKLSYHDYGRLTNDSLKFYPTRNPHTGNFNPQFFLSDSLMILMSEKAAKEVVLQKITPNSPTPRILAGTIVTGDTFVASSIAVAGFKRNYQADATEMEGAAVAQICFQQKLPFLIIRSISDKANEAAPADFQTFKKTAADNSAILVKTILKYL